MVDLARHATGAHLERIAAAYRRAELTASLEAQRVQELRREVTWGYDDYGAVVGRFRLPAEEGRRLIDRLAAHPGSAAGATTAQRAADALMDLIDGDPSTPLITIVHVHADDLTHPAPTHPPANLGEVGTASEEDGDASAETLPPASNQTGGDQPGAVAQRLTCDTAIAVLHTDHAGQPLRLGRRRRTVSAGLRHALDARDRGCRFPGCPADRALHAHHLRHWADGGSTDLDNLVLLCRHHHKIVHDYGWTLRWAPPQPPRPPQLEVVDPNGHPLDPHPIGNRGHLADVDHPGIHPAAIRSLWAGERLDLATAVEVLLWRNHRVGPPLGETMAA